MCEKHCKFQEGFSFFAGHSESVRTAIPDFPSQEPNLGKTEPKKGRLREYTDYLGAPFPFLSLPRVHQKF